MANTKIKNTNLSKQTKKLCFICPYFISQCGIDQQRILRIQNIFYLGTFGYHYNNRGVTADRVQIVKPTILTTTTKAPTTPTIPPIITSAPTTTTNKPTTTTNKPIITTGVTNSSVQWLYVNAMGFKLSWTNNADNTTNFIYEAPMASNGNVYSAFGLSTDQLMVITFFCRVV